MSLYRGIFLVLIFFVGLYVLRDPISNVGPNLDQIVVTPIKSFLNNLKGATTSIPGYSVLPGFNSVDVYPSTSTSSGQIIVTKTFEEPKPIKTKKLEPVESKINYAEESKIKTDLTVAGIIEFTNRERVRAGKKPLQENGFLNKSAQAKLQDMFERQYFEHVSPSGADVADVVDETGYRYIVIGENLALGFFGGDSGVVSAWMESPGHRANLLDSRFSDIGVSVALGSYNGKRQWIAVQHFGKPLSACIFPDSVEKDRIESLRTELQAEQEAINIISQDIERFPANNTSEKVEAYNTRVAVYNNRVVDLKTLVDKYNSKVKEFNTCAGL